MEIDPVRFPYAAFVAAKDSKKRDALSRWCLSTRSDAKMPVDLSRSASR